ncbi:hypothetical protein B0H14DRAFT_3096981 [Mycena olivaceomarginata]|nr:hypothetical protein B0H14DRAFT_3096981 [Mycena olivaceomarginata]
MACSRASGILEEPTEKIPPPGIGKEQFFGLEWPVYSVVSDCSCFQLFHSIGNLETNILYASVLALLSVSPNNARHRLIRHANCVLFLVFCVYVYRDLVPLATFAGIMGKIGLLFITALIIPLFTPRQYIPIDPPLYLLFAFFFFLDHIIFLAYRESQLPEEELYPLCDSDASAHLKTTSFKHLDSFSGNKSGRHIFFGLMRIFHREFTIIAGLLVLRVLTTFSGPVAMNRLLQYIETQDQGVDVGVRPWVWIVMILLGPLVGTTSALRLEAIITQLIFAHSLRIRMKAETTATEDTDDSPVVGSPPSLSHGSDADSAAETVTPENGESSSRSGNDSATVQASTSRITSAARKPSKPEATQVETKKSQGSLVGKINNLVTVDLGTIGDSREFLYLLILGIWFLYVLLGWSVWVGVSSIILLAPSLAIVLAKLVQSAQKERLKYTDERVQSERGLASNVLRMIKLFGWEGKMKARIEDKRDRELIWIRKRRMIDLASGLVNFKVVGRYDRQITTMTLTYATYVTALKTPDYGSAPQGSQVFSSMTVFDLLSWIVSRLPQKCRPRFLDDGSCSCLTQTELLDAFDEKETPALFAADPSSDERFIFQRGRINLVVGPTGSGKTSLLMALLGEMHFIPVVTEFLGTTFREGAGVAYAAQESWVLNETIRTNIVFDTPFEGGTVQESFIPVRLEPDLALFQAGDQTEVGEKGSYALGRTKARLTLARAVYSKASILLLDDVLAALDVHTAQWIVEKCLSGDLIENRTVILVTHNVALARPIADLCQGTISQITKRGLLAAQIREEPTIDAEASTPKPADTVDGKLIVAEEIQLGHVSVKMYFTAMGGNYPLLFFTSFIGAAFVQQCLVVLRTCSLGHWAKQYDQRPAEEVDVVFYLSIFGSISLSVALSTSFVSLVFGQLRASKAIHLSLIASVLRAWLDVTPIFSAIDESFAAEIWPLTVMTISMLVKLAAVVVYTPIFSSPVPSFGAAISGLVSIRAFGAESKFTTDWVAIRVDFLGAIFSAGLATYLVYIKHTSAGDTGFLLNMAITFTSLLLWVVKIVNDFEVQSGLLAYIKIEHEKPATEEGKAPGILGLQAEIFEYRVFLREYSEDGPKVLQDISFHIKSGERVGIVGRTGSGKSSLTLSLLRCIPTDGSVKYDGLDTAELNLDSLRSSITIIPQVPELLSGSLRANLDPFSQYDDGRITLDSTISTGGTNLSVGQRQIFALARAIVRKSKILILDEDYKTDSIIQNSLRQELRGDVSLITVAHRLQTIMDADRIMVLDAGRIVEFDSPKELLKIEDGKLRALVEESGDREGLYAMAGVDQS